MKSINSLINNIKNRISNNDSVKKIEETTNKILHKEDKEVFCCNNTDNKNTEKVEELNKIKIVQPSSSSIFNRSDDIYHLFRPQDNINSYDSSLIMRNVDKCKGTNENIKNSKRIQLYKNKGDISNFNTTIRTNLNKFKIDLSKDLRYKFLNKYSAEDDFNFDIYIFPPPPGTIPSGYYQIPGDITKWRTAYQEKWVSSGGGPSDHGWYSSYWEGNWTSYNTLYYTANFMEYSPTTGKFSNIRSYSVPIRYGATEYHGGTSGSGAYTTHYSGRYSDIGNRGNDYWPSNFSCTFTPPEYIEGWTLYEHSGNIYKYKKTEYGAEIKTTETNTSGKKNGTMRAPNIPDYVSKAASRSYEVSNKLGNSYQIVYWTEYRTKTITPQYNYRMSFDCTTGTFSNPVYDYIENVNYSTWTGSGIAYKGSSTNAWTARFIWSRK